jgi:hypothetical protein
MKIKDKGEDALAIYWPAYISQEESDDCPNAAVA